ncbi:MAG: amino acid adenylation domain-containing protein [Flavobacteriales bacterium]|jgi:D-alanine--poly(phosphoribitol) ligase subunit 1
MHLERERTLLSSWTEECRVSSGMEDRLNQCIDALSKHGDRPAFHIRGTYHAYHELDTAVQTVRAWIRGNVSSEEQVIGLWAEDHLWTYACILALWAEGKAYTPIAPGTPVVRCNQLITQAGIRTILVASEDVVLAGVNVVRTGQLPPTEKGPNAQRVATDALAYLLFTSGTTGQPKGVPITRSALNAFLDAFDALGFTIRPEDQVLQMFELTFDLSVMSYLVPLLYGACVHTVPKDEIKYTYIHELLEDHGITVALMVPSILNYLRPYFEEINCPALRVNLFCGEALPLDLVEAWSHRVPNARILNVYGPTEHTIFCTAYAFDRRGGNKAHNGVLSIGKPMYGTVIGILDHDGTLLPDGSEGELGLAGPQGTIGYWHDPERNATAFVKPTNSTERYYRTGDRCVMDRDGDLLYLGRTDHQVKIQGFRVELAEVEHHARQVVSPRMAVAVAVRDPLGNMELVLVVEGEPMDVPTISRALRTLVPTYMVPTRIRFRDDLPLNANGKIDRPALGEWIAMNT